MPTDVSPARAREDRSRALELIKRLNASRMETVEPVLPLLFALNGKPYRLDDHFPFKALFRTRVPRKRVLKTARQVSKTCRVSGAQRVILADGRRVPGHELRVGDRVLAMDDRKRIVSSRVIDTVRTDPKPSLRIMTRTGVVMDLAETHPLLKLAGWTRAGELKVGDRVAAARRGGEFGDEAVSRDRIVLTAYMLGDGSCCNGNLNITTECAAVVDEIDESARSIGEDVTIRPKDGTSAVKVEFSRRAASPFVRWLGEDGTYGKHAWEKSIPAWVYRLSRNDAALFVSRLWATDGMIKANATRPDISYSSTSRDLAYDVKSLLLKFGIPTTVSQKEAGYKKPDGTYVRCRDAYIVRIETRDGWRRFLAAFDVPGKPPVDIRDVEERNNRDTIPKEVGGLIKEIGSSIRWKHSNSLLSVGLRRTIEYAPTYGKLQRYVDHFREHCGGHPRLRELEDLVDGDLLWDEIESIEPIEAGECWDVTVEGCHNYLLDGVVSHNSTYIACSTTLTSARIPHSKQLIVTPLFEQVRRFSVNYVQPFIDESLIKPLIVDTTCNQSVLQRTFINKSLQIFSYAYLSSNRVRGIGGVYWTKIDEFQDMDAVHVPIIVETMSAAPKPWGLLDMAGTPKGFENPIQVAWENSSQAEWVVKCREAACGHWNFCSAEFDLLKMIGPAHRGIGPRSRGGVPGTVCARCQKPIDPRDGTWLHRFRNLSGEKADADDREALIEDRRHMFQGFHIPQVIMPMHYEDPIAWATLNGKMRGLNNTSPAVFHNEILGESYDMGSKLLTLQELKDACVLPWKNRQSKILDLPQHKRDDYRLTVLAADWGGGGGDGGMGNTEATRRRRISFTTLAWMGIRTDGLIDVLWGIRLLTPNDHAREAMDAKRCIDETRPKYFPHDFSGAGALRETLLMQAGVNPDMLKGFVYGALATDKWYQPVPGVEGDKRPHVRIDRTYSLTLTIQAIKAGKIRFFQFDHGGENDMGLLHDFLALTEEKVETNRSDVYLIRRLTAFSDDFAHAVNLGAIALWKATGAWPDLGGLVKRSPSSVGGGRFD